MSVRGMRICAAVRDDRCRDGIDIADGDRALVPGHALARDRLAALLQRADDARVLLGAGEIMKKFGGPHASNRQPNTRS